MIGSPGCEAARAALPDLLEGPADAQAAAHVAGCAACSAELAALRRVLAAVSDCVETPVPDPGEAYWETFAPRVRRRLEDRKGRAAPAARRPRLQGALRVAAAAVVMIGAAAMALRWTPAPPAARAVVTEAALRDALRAASRGSREVDVLGIDIGESSSTAPEMVPEIGPQRVLEALRDTESPAGLLGLWDDAEFEGLVRELDAAKARRLREDIHRPQG